MKNRLSLPQMIKNNFHIKVACFVLAVIIYLFYQSSLVDKKTLVVPLVVVEDGSMIHVGDCPSHVSVVVKADPDEINYISTSNITATVNLDNITQPGTYSLPVNIRVTDNLMEMDTFEVKPKQDSISLQVERKAFKYVPVTVSIAGEPEHGYEVKDVTVSPITVEIYGPESAVDSIDSVQTGKVSVSNAENSFTTEAYYRELNKLIKVDDVGPYRVTVTLESQRMEKEITPVEVSVLNLHHDLYIENTIPQVSYVIESTVKNVEKFEVPKNSVSIDCSHITEAGTYELPLKFSVPNSISITEKSAETVSVTVGVLENTEKTVESEQPEIKIEPVD